MKTLVRTQRVTRVSENGNVSIYLSDFSFFLEDVLSIMRINPKEEHEHTPFYIDKEEQKEIEQVVVTSYYGEVHKILYDFDKLEARLNAYRLKENNKEKTYKVKGTIADVKVNLTISI